MYRTYEAIYTKGQVIPIEEIKAEEQSKLLIIVLNELHKSASSVSNKRKSLKGKYKNSLSSVDEFIARKHVNKNKVNRFYFLEED